MRFEENVPLAPFTTFHIGGPARHMVRVGTVEELQEALVYAKQGPPAGGLKVLVLGGGSNMLVSDAGFDGLVIKIEIAGVEIQKDSEEGTEKEKDTKKAVLIAGAGENWDAVVARSVQEDLWGLENLSGIPGTVGGAVVQNIGAYGAAVSEVLAWVEVFDTEHVEKDGDAVKRMSVKECLFDYRDSIFKHEQRYIVTRAAFSLSQEAKTNLSYKDLAERFGSLGASAASAQDIKTPGLEAIRDAVLGIRKAKFPDLLVEGTAGSFFKNPILDKAEAEALKAKYPEMPLFAMPETSGVKVPLAWFLDYRHGVMDVRKLKVGGARLFEKQPLVIAAARGASASDVQELQKVVAEKVFDETKIKIEPEVKIIF